jgi:hypothetical protein
MTRTEADLATTIASVADDVVVDTDAFVAAVKQRHRRRRRRQVSVAAGAAAVLTVGAGVPAVLHASGITSPTAVPSGPVGGWATTPRIFTGDCWVEAVPAPLDVEPGHPVWVEDADPTGRFLVGTYGPPVGPDGWSNMDGPTGRILPVRWDSGVGRVIPVAGPDLRDVRPVAVNRHGAIAGIVRHPDVGGNGFLAWVSLDGTAWNLLPIPQGYVEAYALSITDDGTVLGAAYSTTSAHAAVVWTRNRSGVWLATVTPLAQGAAVSAITDDGWIVGSIGSGQPYVWGPDGTGRELPLPDHATWGSVDQVRGEWAVGLAGQEDAKGPLRITTHIVRWNVRTGETTIVADRPSMGTVAAVNSRGDVAWFDGSNVVLVRNGRTYVLPEVPEDLTRMPPPFTEPVALTDDATLIVGHDALWWC